MAGTMNAKPTSTLNNFISTNGHAAGIIFQFALEGRTFQVVFSGVDFQENMSGNLVP